MLTRRRIHATLAATKLLLFAVWPTAAYAAVTIMNTLEGLTWAIVGILFFISTLAGLTSLVYRLDKEVRHSGKPMVAPLMFAAVNMLGAWTAAVFAFFVAEGTNLGDWTELGLVLVFSFGGARLLERAVDKYIDKYLGAGMPPSPPPPMDQPTLQEPTDEPNSLQ